MRTKAVLIIGGSGFIGTHLALRLRENYKVFATYRTHPMQVPGVTYVPFSVENRNWVKRIVYTAQPDAIIYAAGRNDVHWAEEKPREAELVHTGGPATVANLATIFQSRFIYLSNCYTFDGIRGNYHETDTVLPGNSLGKAKVGGENYIRGKALHYVIVRSSPVYGRGTPLNLSFVDRLRMALDRGLKVEVPASELHSFAPVGGLVELVARLVETGVRNRVLHYGGLTKLSYYDFARDFAQRFGYDPALLIPRIGDGKRDFSLNSTQATELLKLQPLLVEQGLDLLEKSLVVSA